LPTTMNGAHCEGCASISEPFSISAFIDRLNALRGRSRSLPSLIAASEPASQCDTSSVRSHVATGRRDLDRSHHKDAVLSVGNDFASQGGPSNAPAIAEQEDV
jgi:hypothetical protein